MKKLVTSKVTYEMQSAAYWKGKTEHIWYDFEEQFRIQLISCKTCALLSVAL